MLICFASQARVTMPAKRFKKSYAKDMFGAQWSKAMMTGVVSKVIGHGKSLLYGVIWDQDLGYDEHRKSQLKLAPDTPPLRLILCRNRHVMGRHPFCVDVSCDQCGVSASKNTFWVCEECDYDLCSGCARDKWEHV